MTNQPFEVRFWDFICILNEVSTSNQTKKVFISKRINKITQNISRQKEQFMLETHQEENIPYQIQQKELNYQIDDLKASILEFKDKINVMNQNYTFLQEKQTQINKQIHQNCSQSINIQKQIKSIRKKQLQKQHSNKQQMTISIQKNDKIKLDIKKIQFQNKQQQRLLQKLNKKRKLYLTQVVSKGRKNRNKNLDIQTMQNGIKSLEIVTAFKQICDIFIFKQNHKKNISQFTIQEQSIEIIKEFTKLRNQFQELQYQHLQISNKKNSLQQLMISLNKSIFAFPQQKTKKQSEKLIILQEENNKIVSFISAKQNLIRLFHSNFNNIMNRLSRLINKIQKDKQLYDQFSNKIFYLIDNCHQVVQSPEILFQRNEKYKKRLFNLFEVEIKKILLVLKEYNANKPLLPATLCAESDKYYRRDNYRLLQKIETKERRQSRLDHILQDRNYKFDNELTERREPMQRSLSRLKKQFSFRARNLQVVYGELSKVINNSVTSRFKKAFQKAKTCNQSLNTTLII